MKFRFIFTSVLMCVLLLTSCVDNKIDDTTSPVVEGFEQPVTETTDEYSITFQYNEGVIVLSESALDYIVRVEADSIIYFAPSTPSELIPEVGGVVTARVSEKLPFGLGNKVIDVSEQGGMTRCVTTHAPLDEIYKELSWEYNASLTDSLLEGYVDENGNAIQPIYVWYNEETGEYEKEPTKGTIGRHKLVEWPYEFEHKELNVEGAIYIGAFVHCSGDVRNNDFEFYIEPIIGTDALVQAGIIFEKNIWQDMYEWNIFKLKDIVKGVIQLGPLTLRPYVDIEAYLDFAASGTITIGLSKTFSARIGYSQTNGCYISNNTIQGNEDKLFNRIDMLNGNIGGKYRCLFDVGCGLYTKKIAIAIEPYFEYSLGAQLLLTLPEDEDKSIQKEATASFDIVVGADGKMVVDWFGGLKWAPQMKFIETNIFHAETSLIPSLEEDTFTFNETANGYIPTYESGYNISGGLLSSILDIYPGIAIYKDGTLVHKELYTEKTVWNDTIPATYVISGLEADASYEAQAIARILGYDLELDKNLGKWGDLGLPSGLLWAAYNVGASSSEEYGGYYAWGETEEKSSYTWENYKWRDKIIGPNICGTEHDVAFVKWGNGARLPNLNELKELCSHCSWQHNSTGALITGPNGNKIFIPFASALIGNKLHDDPRMSAFIWSGTAEEDDDYQAAFCLEFGVDIESGWEYFYADEGCQYGFSVRPVKEK